MGIFNLQSGINNRKSADLQSILGTNNMNAFTIRYRNTQGTLMRILNGASRRGLDLHYVHAEAAEHDHQVTLVLEVNQKQVGQLYREWYSIADVIHVGAGAGQAAWTSAHPPAGVPLDESRTAARA
jgi:acetolactate synthase regulatory subunit